MDSVENKVFGIITSKWGHFFQIYKLINLFCRKKRFWITFYGEDTKNYLKGEKKYYAYYPESRNIINALRNLFLAIKIFHLEHPNCLISTGAGIAVPFFIIGKIFFRTKLIYIEPFDYVAYPTLTGKILYNITDLFLVQNKIQQKWYPKAKFWGSLL